MEKNMEHYLFNAEEKYAKKSSNESFYLHSHNEYEIYLFLEGDSNCIVENKTYGVIGFFCKIQLQSVRKCF